MKRPTVGEVIVYPAKGGLETVSIPGTTTVGRLLDGEGFVVDINGAKRKQPGIVRQDSNTTQLAPDGNARGLFDFWRTSANIKVRRTVLVASGKVYADSGDGFYTDVTGPFSMLSTDNVAMETFFGLLVLAFEHNPGNQILKYDQGATLAALGGSPPNGKYIRTFANRLWVAGISGAPDRLRGSVIDDPEDWSLINGSESINIDQGDQDPIGITSLFPPFYDRMVVAKRRSLYQIQPVDTTFGVSPVIIGIGCLSHNGVQSLDTDVIYPSERGIHLLSMTNKLGQIDTSFASAPIQDFYQESISFDRAENMRSIYCPELNSYLLSYTTKSATNNDVILGYNFAIGEWYKWNENVSAFCRYVDPNDGFKTKVLVADDGGRVGILDTTKSGRTVTWFGERRRTQFTTGIIYPLGVNKEVTFQKLRLYFKPSVLKSYITVSYLVNGAFQEDLVFPTDPFQSGAVIGSAIIGVDKIGANGYVKTVMRNLHGVGSAIQLVFTHDPIEDDDDCEIYGFVIEYEYSGESDRPKQQ